MVGYICRCGSVSVKRDCCMSAARLDTKL
jgi:hypothetical protein